MIRDFLVEEGHTITRDWLQNIRNKEEPIELTNPGSSPGHAEFIYKRVRRALEDADILILEDTVSSFSNGHLVTLALSRKKPILVLWNDKHKKIKKFKTNFIEGIESNYLEIHRYGEDNYKKIIRAFINKYSNANEKHRFHLVLDEVERDYIDWAQYHKGKSRTKVIRDALRKELDSDEKYNSYLERGA